MDKVELTVYGKLPELQLNLMYSEGKEALDQVG